MWSVSESLAQGRVPPSPSGPPKASLLDLPCPQSRSITVCISWASGDITQDEKVLSFLRFLCNSRESFLPPLITKFVPNRVIGEFVAASSYTAQPLHIETPFCLFWITTPHSFPVPSTPSVASPWSSIGGKPPRSSLAFHRWISPLLELSPHSNFHREAQPLY